VWGRPAIGTSSTPTQSPRASPRDGRRRPLLDAYAGHSAAGPQIQRKTRIVDDPTDLQNTTRVQAVVYCRTPGGPSTARTSVVFGPLLNDCGTYMEALITLNHYDPGGTEPQTGTWPSWWNAAAPSPQLLGARSLAQPPPRWSG